MKPMIWSGNNSAEHPLHLLSLGFYWTFVNLMSGLSTVEAQPQLNATFPCMGSGDVDVLGCEDGVDGSDAVPLLACWELKSMIGDLEWSARERTLSRAHLSRRVAASISSLKEGGLVWCSRSSLSCSFKPK